MSQCATDPVSPALAGPSLKRRIGWLFGLLIGANLAAWAWALVAFAHRPDLLALAAVAYGFGLRHAVDADHIAAIDNVTRKLIHDGKRPLGVGLFFSLGHATVVIAACLVIALASALIQSHLGDYAPYRHAGAILGTAVSAGFLLLIAAANLLIFLTVWRAWRKLRAGSDDNETDIQALVAKRGLIARALRGTFQLIGQSWHMYPLGFLFGLGFDTATEIGVMSLAVAGAAKGLAVGSVLIFPVLFTAGMALVDTADGTLMLGAYGWASVDPERKLGYNLAITGLSVLVATAVAAVETLGLLHDQFGGHTAFSRPVIWANSHLGLLGTGIIFAAAAIWAVARTWPTRRA